MTLIEMNLETDLKQIMTEVSAQMQTIIRVHNEEAITQLAGLVLRRCAMHEQRTDLDAYDNGHFARNLSSYLRTLDHMMADWGKDALYRQQLPSWSTWALNLYKQYGKIVSL